MKALFFTINFGFGALSLILGFATLLSVTHSYSFAAAVVGIITLAMAIVCLGLCKDCLMTHFKQRV